MIVSLLEHGLMHWLLNRDPDCRWCHEEELEMQARNREDIAQIARWN